MNKKDTNTDTDIATRIVYYYCMRLKSHTHILLFLLGLDYVYFCLLLVAR